ncbi:MAG: hypothetical protein ACLQDY_10125 [Streptosporangiaceae bacterium]
MARMLLFAAAAVAVVMLILTVLKVLFFGLGTLVLIAAVFAALGIFRAGRRSARASRR